jgi:hypothetical protein
MLLYGLERGTRSVMESCVVVVIEPFRCLANRFPALLLLRPVRYSAASRCLHRSMNSTHSSPDHPKHYQTLTSSFRTFCRSWLGRVRRSPQRPSFKLGPRQNVYLYGDFDRGMGACDPRDGSYRPSVLPPSPSIGRPFLLGRIRRIPLYFMTGNCVNGPRRVPRVLLQIAVSPRRGIAVCARGWMPWRSRAAIASILSWNSGFYVSIQLVLFWSLI